MPTAIAEVNESSQCLWGNHFEFNNHSVINSGTLSFEWQWKDGNSSHQKNPHKSYDKAGTYPVELYAISDHDCRDTTRLNIQVFPMPFAGFMVPDTAQCLKDNLFECVRIYKNPADSSQALVLRDEWTIEQDTFQTNQPRISHQFKSVGNHPIYLKTTSVDGCIDSSLTTITVYPHPLIDLGEDRYVNPDLPVSEILDAGEGFASYLWNQSSNEQRITASDTGWYAVTIRNSEGCESTDSVKIYFWNTVLSNHPFASVHLIKSFPNPAQHAFTLWSEGANMQEIHVFDQDGKRVFTTSGIHAQQVAIDAAHWAAATYIIRVKTEKGWAVFRQIIIH
jgi:PKD repeat protein